MKLEHAGSRFFPPGQASSIEIGGGIHGSDEKLHIIYALNVRRFPIAAAGLHRRGKRARKRDVSAHKEETDGPAGLREWRSGRSPVCPRDSTAAQSSTPSTVSRTICRMRRCLSSFLSLQPHWRPAVFPPYPRSIIRVRSATNDPFPEAVTSQRRHNIVVGPLWAGRDLTESHHVDPGQNVIIAARLAIGCMCTRVSFLTSWLPPSTNAEHSAGSTRFRRAMSCVSSIFGSSPGAAGWVSWLFRSHGMVARSSDDARHA